MSSINLMMFLIGDAEPKSVVILNTAPNVVEIHTVESSIPALERKLTENMPITLKFVFKPLSSTSQSNIRRPILLDSCSM